MINPYTYVRFLAGHYLILLGYAVVPFVIKSFFDLFSNQSKENIIKSALWITLVGILNLHYLFMISIVFLIFVLFHLFKNFSKAEIIKTAKSVLYISIIFIFLGAYWIIPLFNTEKTILNQIGEGDVSLFSSKSAIDFNAIFNVASMHGFWRGGYDYAKYHMRYWHVLFIFILFLSVYGYTESSHKYKIPLLITGVISLFLAVGIASPYFNDIYKWLFENFFIFRGMREPHKFVGLLVFPY